MASAEAAISSSLEDDVTHFTCERGIGLLVELACNKASVLSAACAESRACYIGVHGNLEKVSTQNQVVDLVNQVMQKLTMTRSVSDRELGEVHLFCHVTCHFHAQVDLRCRTFQVENAFQNMRRSFSNSCQLVKSC